MRFRKKPVITEAVQWTGTRESFEQIKAFAGAAVDVLVKGVVPRQDNVCTLLIETLEGDMTASLGDWIIRGVKGELYPCKPDIFEATYEPEDPGTL